MQKIIYVPPGGDFDDAEKRIVLAAEEPFILEEISGIGGVEADIISSEVVGMDGEYFQGCKQNSRPIKCKLWVDGKNRADMYSQRMRLIGMLRPSSEQGTLYYENDHISVKIKAVPQLPPDFKERIRNYNGAEIQFYCCSPQWQSLEEKKADIAYIPGSGFTFPRTLNSIRFIYMKDTVTIDYKGTAPTPVIITVEGPSETPAITNETTGKTIMLTRSLLSGELLVINTERGNKSVSLYSGDTVTDAFGYLSPMSVFWELKPGLNRIVYGNGGTAQTSVHIRYYERYSGV